MILQLSLALALSLPCFDEAKPTNGMDTFKVLREKTMTVLGKLADPSAFKTFDRTIELIGVIEEYLVDLLRAKTSVRPPKVVPIPGTAKLASKWVIYSRELEVKVDGTSSSILGTTALQLAVKAKAEYFIEPKDIGSMRLDERRGVAYVRLPKVQVEKPAIDVSTVQEIKIEKGWCRFDYPYALRTSLIESTAPKKVAEVMNQELDEARRAAKEEVRRFIKQLFATTISDLAVEFVDEKVPVPVGASA